MNLQKNKPVRNQKYLDWVKTLNCSVCGTDEGIDAHHIISCGEGGMGTKATDLFVIPLCRMHHTWAHNGNKEILDDQWQGIARTLQEAVKQGVLIFTGEYPK